MNRAQRREFFREARLKNIPKDVAQVYFDAIEANQRAPDKEICTGDTVLVNSEQIMSNVNYERMNDEYKRFVESAKGKEFKAIVLENNLVSLDGVEKWLFWQGDLIKREEVLE